MNKDDLADLEEKLSLSLPDAYKQVVLNHPGFFRQHELCDFVDPLVYDNRMLRTKGFFGLEWDNRFFAIGSDGTGNVYYITTDLFDGNVYFADHEGGAKPTDLEGAKAFDSLDAFVESLREQHAIIQADIRRTNELIRNRKWYQFWIPTELMRLDDEV
jgi:hypothetical protein